MTEQTTRVEQQRLGLLLNRLSYRLHRIVSRGAAHPGKKGQDKAEAQEPASPFHVEPLRSRGERRATIPRPLTTAAEPTGAPQ